MSKSTASLKRSPKSNSRQGSSRPATSTVADVRPSSAAQVYESVRNDILTLQLHPDEELDEKELVARYRVSRTPVREAMIRLAAEGLIRLVPNRAARVASLHFTNLVDHQEAMEVLWPATCYLAALRRDEQDIGRITTAYQRLKPLVRKGEIGEMVVCNFDLICAVADAAHNASLRRAFSAIASEKLRLSFFERSSVFRDSSSHLSNDFSESIPIYEKLFAAITGSDPLAAEEAAREHNRHIRESLVRHIQASPITSITRSLKELDK